MLTSLARITALALLPIGLAGCFCTGCYYRSVYDEHTLEIQQAGAPANHASLQVLGEPPITLKPQGCSGTAGLTAPPVIFDLVFQSKLAVTPPEFATLTVKGKDIDAYRISAVLGRVGGDRIEIGFMIRCSDLDGATLKLGALKVQGQPTSIGNISFRHSMKTKSEWNKTPDQWWK